MKTLITAIILLCLIGCSEKEFTQGDMIPGRKYKLPSPTTFISDNGNLEGINLSGPKTKGTATYFQYYKFDTVTLEFKGKFYATVYKEGIRYETYK